MENKQVDFEIVTLEDWQEELQENPGITSVAAASGSSNCSNNAAGEGA